MQNTLKILTSEDCIEFSREALDMFKHYSMDLSFLPKDGFKIIEIIENSSPDIVLMDLFMPRIDAIGIINAVRKNRRVEMPTFIVISSFGKPSLEREVMSAGASHFLVKPVNYSDVIEKILQISYREKANDDLSLNRSLNLHTESSENLDVKITEVLHQI